MLSRSFLPTVLALVLVSACKGSGDAAKPGPAADAASASSSGSPAAASAPLGAGAFAGKLTPAIIASYESPPRLFQMTADEAVAEVSKKLGRPTGQDARKVVWGASDGVTCRSYSIQVNAGAVTGGSKRPEVKASEFGEQWGKTCLLEAGVSPERRPYEGKTYSVAELLASKPGASPLRVRGVLSEPQPAGSTGASFLLTDEATPTAHERCALEFGALSPTAWNGKVVTVECASRACNHCFMVK